jgi:hypothetical protein
MQELRLAAEPGGSKNPVEMLWTELSVRAEGLPGLAGTPRTARPFPWWLVAAGATAVVATIAGFWWRASTLRARADAAAKPRPRSRPRSEPPAPGPANGAPRPARPAPTPAWDDESLRRIEERVAAYAREHPEATSTSSERPRFRFGLRDGVLNGSFVVWEDADRGEARPPDSNPGQVRAKPPVRFKGSYRDGKRDGPFVFRDAAGSNVFVEYRGGEQAG